MCGDLSGSEIFLLALSKWRLVEEVAERAPASESCPCSVAGMMDGGGVFLAWKPVRVSSWTSAFGHLLVVTFSDFGIPGKGGREVPPFITAGDQASSYPVLCTRILARTTCGNRRRCERCGLLPRWKPGLKPILGIFLIFWALDRRPFVAFCWSIVLAARDVGSIDAFQV
jgi:hypothetical protein